MEREMKIARAPSYKALAAKCRSAGALIADGPAHIEIEAPKGMIFAGVGTHSVVATVSAVIHHGDERYPESWINDAVKSLEDDFAGGFEPCDDPECEWCHESEQ